MPDKIAPHIPRELFPQFDNSEVYIIAPVIAEVEENAEMIDEEDRRLSDDRLRALIKHPKDDPIWTSLWTKKERRIVRYGQNPAKDALEILHNAADMGDELDMLVFGMMRDIPNLFELVFLPWPKRNKGVVALVETLTQYSIWYIFDRALLAFQEYLPLPRRSLEITISAMMCALRSGANLEALLESHPPTHGSLLAITETMLNTAYKIYARSIDARGWVLAGLEEGSESGMTYTRYALGHAPLFVGRYSSRGEDETMFYDYLPRLGAGGLNIRFLAMLYDDIKPTFYNTPDFFTRLMTTELGVGSLWTDNNATLQPVKKRLASLAAVIIINTVRGMVHSMQIEKRFSLGMTLKLIRRQFHPSLDHSTNLRVRVRYVPDTYKEERTPTNIPLTSNIIVRAIAFVPNFNPEKLQKIKDRLKGYILPDLPQASERGRKRDHENMAGWVM